MKTGCEIKSNSVYTEMAGLFSKVKDARCETAHGLVAITAMLSAGLGSPISLVVIAQRPETIAKFMQSILRILPPDLVVNADQFKLDEFRRRLYRGKAITAEKASDFKCAVIEEIIHKGLDRDAQVIFIGSLPEKSSVKNYAQVIVLDLDRPVDEKLRSLAEELEKQSSESTKNALTFEKRLVLFHSEIKLLSIRETSVDENPFKDMRPFVAGREVSFTDISAETQDVISRCCETVGKINRPLILDSPDSISEFLKSKKLFEPEDCDFAIQLLGDGLRFSKPAESELVGRQRTYDALRKLEDVDKFEGKEPKGYMVKNIMEYLKGVSPATVYRDLKELKGEEKVYEVSRGYYRVVDPTSAYNPKVSLRPLEAAEPVPQSKPSDKKGEEQDTLTPQIPAEDSKQQDLFTSKGDPTPTSAA